MNMLQRIFTAGLLFFALLCYAQKTDLKSVRHGVVCFTFDDGKYKEWLPQMELFRKYNAKATFFYNGKVTREAAESMLILRRNGHSVGLHTVHHKICSGKDMQKYFDEEIRPQLDDSAKNGVKEIRCFAYPNNRHTPESDAFLSKYFSRFRVGHGIRLPEGFRIADQESLFIPLSEVSKRKVLGGCGIGERYRSTAENLDAALEKAAKENKLIVFYSHGISPKAKGVHMPLELLTHLLKKASELKMAIIGFDALPE